MEILRTIGLVVVLGILGMAILYIIIKSLYLCWEHLKGLGELIWFLSPWIVLIGSVIALLCGMFQLAGIGIVVMIILLVIIK